MSHKEYFEMRDWLIINLCKKRRSVMREYLMFNHDKNNWSVSYGDNFLML